MAGRASLAALAGLAIMAPASVAGAATVGSISTAAPINCGTGPVALVQEHVSVNGPSYTIPARGVVTRWRTINSATSTSGLLLVTRVAGDMRAMIVGTTPVTLTPTPSHITTVSGVHIRARAGDRLGTGLTATTANWPCARGAPGDDEVVTRDPTPGFAAGTTFSTATPLPMALLNVEATVEPDADDDGFGDSSQDSCPAISEIHTGPCKIDLAIKTVALDKTVAIGDLAVFTLRVHDVSTGPSPGATLSDRLPAGLKPLLAGSSSGSCKVGPKVTCDLGPVGPGKDVTVTIVAAARKAGVWRNSATVEGTAAPDPHEANNTSSASVTVGACRVPDVVGETVSGARKALRKAGCKLGRKLGQGKHVVKQRPRAGTHQRFGAQVSVTLGK